MKRGQGIKKHHHGNYGKMSTKKQRRAQQVNFAIFRLEGIQASLLSIMGNEYLPHIATDRLTEARRHVRDSLSVIRNINASREKYGKDRSDLYVVK